MNWLRSLYQAITGNRQSRLERQERQEHHQSEAERLDRIRNPGKYLDRVNADRRPPPSR